MQTNDWCFFTITEALENYLTSLENEYTQRSIHEAFTLLFHHKVLDPLLTLKDFRCLNTNAILDFIRGHLYYKDKPLKLADSTRQKIAGYFIGWTRFISRLTNGEIKRAIPNCEAGASRTYAHKRLRTKAEILTKPKIESFLTALKQFSPEGFFFASLQLHGAKRRLEVQRTQVEHINWNLNQIVFTPVKTGRIVRHPVTITFPGQFMLDLQCYIVAHEMKTGYLFPKSKCCTAEHITADKIKSLYKKAWKMTSFDVPKSLTHCLRATCITHLIKTGVNYENVALMTAQQLSSIRYYDLSGNENNPSSNLCILPVGL